MVVVGNFSNSTKLSLLEHPLGRSTKMMNLVLRYTLLVNPDFIDLDCSGNFSRSGAIFGGSRAGGAVPNRA